MNQRSIVIIDRDASFRMNAERFLSERGFAVAQADSGHAGLEQVARVQPEAILLDLGLNHVTGADLVDRILGSVAISPKIVCVSDGSRVGDVVAAVKAGALDVLERPVDGEKLIRILDRAQQTTADLAPPPVAIPAVRPLRLARDPSIDHLVADSEAMRRVLEEAERMSHTEGTIVLEGEPGVGQEGVARHMHARGPRAQGPFVLVPAVPEQGTAEQALFGSAEMVSAFAQAKGGVVFIESLTSLGDSGQERLAKLLQGLAAARVSGTSVRWPPMIIGVERPLAVNAEAGRVREDLVPALAQCVIRIPPLRERRGDIPELVHRIVATIQAQVGAPGWHVEPAVMDALVKRDWEGNVPELITATRRAAAFGADGYVVLDLSARFAEPPPPPPMPVAPVEVKPPEPVEWKPTVDADGRVQPYDVYEAQIFRFALENAGGCVSRAAELLGVGRATMYRKMRAYKITVPPVSERAISRSRKPKKRADTAAKSTTIHSSIA